MISLFAHHDETIGAWEYPVLAAFFAIGIWLGWDLVGRCMARRREPAAVDGAMNGSEGPRSPEARG